MSSNAMSKFLWKLGSDDPRYRNFLLAQGMDMIEDFKKNSLFDTILYRHKERIEMYKYYYQLYYGNHWFNISEENIDPIKVNYCFNTVNKHVAFLMNKGFTIYSEFPDIQRFLQRNWELNKAGLNDNTFGIELGLLGSITGDAFIEILLANNEDTGEDYIKYKLLKSHYSFPVIERDRMRGFLYYGEEEFITKENFGFAEYSTRNEGFYYSPGRKVLIIDEQNKSEFKYDYLQIPVVHIKNFPMPANFYGVSDLINIYELNLIYDRIMTDVQDIIDYHSQPVTILKGASVSSLQRGPNRVWGIPQNADIKNLQLEGDLGATQNHLKNIRENLSEMTNIPEGAAGKSMAISNTSSAALAIAFMPLYETMDYKRITYGSAFLRMNSITIKYAIIKGLLDVNRIIRDAVDKWEGEYTNYSKEIKEAFYPFNKEVNLETDFNSLSVLYSNEIPGEIFQTAINWLPPLPKDDTMQAQITSSMVNANIWSKRKGRLQSGMSLKEAILEEIQMKKELAENPQLTKEGTIITNMNNESTVKGQQEAIRREKENAV